MDSFSKYGLKTCCMSGSVLSTGNLEVKKATVQPHEASELAQRWVTSAALQKLVANGQAQRLILTK